MSEGARAAPRCGTPGCRAAARRWWVVRPGGDEGLVCHCDSHAPFDFGDPVAGPFSPSELLAWNILRM